MTSETVKEYGKAAGASVVGVASFSAFGRAPDGFKPTDIMEDCLSVVVLGAPSPREVLGDVAEYTASRNAMLSAMTDIAKKVEKQIKSAGHKAKAISASGGRTIDGKMWGHISLKHAAELAGLGRIGRNYLLTNDTYGNLLWISAVLTDADLVPDGLAQYSVCDNCNKCVENCPSGALENLDAFGRKGCAQFFRIVNKKLEIQCHLCRSICPHRFGTA